MGDYVGEDCRWAMAGGEASRESSSKVGGRRPQDDAACGQSSKCCSYTGTRCGAGCRSLTDVTSFGGRNGSTNDRSG
jgi:hypothetical protein